MKKSFYFWLFLALLSAPLAAWSQCTTSAGTIQSWQAVVCGESDLVFVSNNDAVLDGDDVRVFVAFIGPDPVTGTVLSVISGGNFPYNPVFHAVSNFQIAPVAGNNDGSGGVDWADPCLSVGPAVSVFYPPLFDVSVSGGIVSCNGQPAILNASATAPGVTFFWTGPNGFSASGPTAITFNPGTYCVVVTDQFGCVEQACVDVVVDASIPSISIVPPPPLSCTNPTVTLQGVIAPPGPNYFVLWTGPNGFTSSDLEPVVSVPGVYQLFVQNLVNGCSSQAIVTVATDNPVYISHTPLQTPLCYGDSLYIEPVAPNMVPPLTYAWSNGSTAPGMIITQQITPPLCVTLTDATGCSVAHCLDPFSIDYPPFMDVIFIPEIVACDVQVWIVSVTGANQPVTYTWTDNINSNTNFFQAFESGIYGVTVTDFNGCTAAADTFLEVNPGQCAVIRGNVFRDADLDCAFDNGEPALAGWFVQATSGVNSFYATTDSAGNYKMSVNPGTYDVAVLPLHPDVWMPCVSPINVGALVAGDTADADFPIKPLFDCPLMSVDISAPLLRRCFDNNYYYGTYCNNGTVAATDVYVDLTLDAFMTIQGASLPYTDLGNNVIRIELGDVADGECGNFQVQVAINCDAVLGQTHCTEAHIYPDTLCAGAPGWQGANVVVTGDCAQDSVYFTIKNTGQIDMSVPLEYVVIEDAIMFMVANGPALGAGDSLRVGLPVNGSTWRVVSNQEPNHPNLPGLPTAWVEGCTGGSGSTFSLGYVNLFSDGDATPWLDIDCTPNVGSYDPNDKQGFPLGYGAQHYIRPATPLEYLIRFQNTGTDTAFTVVVRDTLSAWLDASSVRPGASSHPYKLDLYGEGVLSFTFENILLPDSNVNAAASNGFVKFLVNPRAEAPLETDIFNQAAIYFDFNEPVLTNTTVHRIGNDFLVGAWQPARPALGLQIAPHPVLDEAQVTVSGLSAGQSLTLRWFDTRGQLLRSETAVAPTFDVRRDGLPAGLYFLELSDRNGLTGHLKVVVR